MPETDKSISENNSDANDFRLWTTLYLMDVFRQRLKNGEISQFGIGNGVQNFNTLSNNIVIHTNDNATTYALQVKYSANKMDWNYLTKNPKTCIYMFFKSYLDIGKVDQLILWTNMDFDADVRDYFEKYVPETPASDLLGDGLYTRYRLKADRISEIAQHFLIRSHPRAELVNKVIDAMFSSKVLDSGRVFQQCHRVMARDIVECNGKESCFRQCFIDGDLEDEESKKFRDCFIIFMRERCTDKGLGEFCMQKLNSDTRFQLSVDGKFGKRSKSDDIKWPDWKDGPCEEDLKDFFYRYVLYVNVAKLKTLKMYLINKVVDFDQFGQLSELVRKCTSQQMVDHHGIDRIFTLLKLRENVNRNPYIKNKLEFDDEGLKALEREVKNFSDKKSYLVKASIDTECTVSRLLMILKKLFVPDSEQCLTIRSCDLVNEDDDILVVLKDNKLVEFGVKCVIISGVTSEELPIKEALLQSLQVLKIFVGNDLNDCYVDDFDVSFLDTNSKSMINEKTICWSKTQEATVEKIFSDKLFRKENHQLVLELFRSQTIRINTNELDRDPYYIARLAMTNNRTKYDLIEAEEIFDGQLPTSTENSKTVIISDQPGSGKTVELVNIALELRSKYQHYLIVYLDCKAVLPLFADNDVINMVCRGLATVNKSEALLVAEMFHQRKVILLLDGYDEVSENMHGQLNWLIRNASENIFRLYIATRPHYEKDIIFHNSSSICQLVPFSVENQLNYLEQFWHIEFISDCELRSTAKENAKILIQNFRRMLSGSLVGIPLQTHMIAVIYKATIKSKHFEQPTSFEIGFLYKRFLELKFQIAIQRNMDLVDATHEIVINMLLKSIEPQHCIMARRLLDDDTENADKAKELQPYGIVRLQPPAFVHKTYQEYFLSLYFLTHFTGANDHFRGFIHNFMLQNILIMEFLDYHIGCIDPKIDLYTDFPEEISEDFENSGYNSPSSARLHPAKMKEFNIYLERANYCEQNFVIIEYILSYSLINLFEALYDALPNSIKSHVHFVFIKSIVNSNTTVLPVDARLNPRSYITTTALAFMQSRDFVRPSDPLVIKILKILQTKHPDDFIRRFLLNMKRSNSFLRWIFRRTNVEALEWFMTLLPQLSDDDRADLGKYLDHRKLVYLEDIMQRNASQFWQKMIDCLKKIFCKESVAWHLQKNHVFSHFISHIEFDETNALEVTRRIDMVKTMYEFYKWAFGESLANGVIYVGFANNINKFKYTAIRNAFRETFFQDNPDLIIV